MRLDFNYIIVDDDLKRRRTKHRVKKIQETIDKKISSKGLKPIAKLYKSLEEFHENEQDLDPNRFDLYLSDNNLGNNDGSSDEKHANDGIEFYLDIHNRFPCDFILYTGSTQDQIIANLVNHLQEKKDPGLFSRFTFISRSSDPNDNWHGKIEDVIDLIISNREEMNNMRGFYAQLTSQIHRDIKNNLRLHPDLSFYKTIKELRNNISKYPSLENNDIDTLDKIRRIRNGLMHEDERKCENTPHTYYLLYYSDDKNTIEERIYATDFDKIRTELKNTYDKLCQAFK